MGFRGVASSINGAFIMIGHVILMVVGGAMSQTTAPAADVETQLSKRPHYSMLLDLLKTTGLLDQLKALPQMTLFAPTNAALLTCPMMSTTPSRLTRPGSQSSSSTT